MKKFILAAALALVFSAATFTPARATSGCAPPDCDCPDFGSYDDCEMGRKPKYDPASPVNPSGNPSALPHSGGSGYAIRHKKNTEGFSTAVPWGDAMNPGANVSAGVPVDIHAIQNYSRARANLFSQYRAAGNRLPAGLVLETYGVKSGNDLHQLFLNAQKVAEKRVAYFYRLTRVDRSKLEGEFTRYYRELLFFNPGAMRAWYNNVSNIFSGINSPGFTDDKNDLMYSTPAEATAIFRLFGDTDGSGSVGITDWK